MKNLVKFSVDKAITVFMAVIIVIVFGVVSYTNLTTDLFPSMNIPFSVVVTVYPGASPTEIEEVVTEPIEQALATTTNIKEVTSISQENVSVVILEFNSDTNMDSAVIEMRETLDMAISNMPDMVGSPMIIKINPDMMPIMQLSVSKEGLTSQELTIYVEEEVLPQIERVPGVASVSVSGAYESEVQVILDQTALDTINAQLTLVFEGLGIDEEDMMLLDKELISGILTAQNFEFPVGYTNVGGVDYLVRVGDEFDSVEEVENLTVFNIPANPGMGILEPIVFTIDDIADVSFVNANDKEYSKVNGENAISITVQKSSEFATTDVTDAINKILKDISEETEGTNFTVLLDQGEYIDLATGSVVTNLLYGAALAVVVLFIFLRSARATLIVAVSIPISLMFAIVLIYFSGITLNIVSLGGLALGIGMLVDNSIVVMENIFRLKKLGKSNREAAIEGTRSVAGAIFASTITTISVFVPVLFIEGFIKEIFLQMALTIAYSLAASLVIALTLVPAISSKVLKEDGKAVAGEEKGSNKAKEIYEKIFNGAFKFKYFILALVVVLFGGSIYIALTNGFEYFPESDEGQLVVSITNPTESPLSDDDFFTLLDDMTDDILLIDSVDVVGISLGSMQGSFLGFSSADSASANVVLKDGRDLSTMEVENLIETMLLEDYSEIEFTISGSQQQTSMLTGSGYQVELKGYDLDILKAEATKIAAIIAGVDGVEEVDNGVGKPADEIKITVDKDLAIAQNVFTAQVMGVVAEFLAPEEVVTEITVEGDIYEVYVYDSAPEDTEYTLEDIENIVIGLNMMTFTPIYLKDVATVEIQQGFTSISHNSGIRTLTISATYDETYNSTFVASDIDDALADYDAPDGYTFEIMGENEEIMEAMTTLVLAMLLAVALIYMIMAAQFQSLTYPLIIMFTIPLAFTGGFLILFFAGMPVSVVAMIGFIILVGVVVNNGIVLVDYTNQLREQGMEVKEALLEAGKTRLRPIVMTALTTILALITMALGIGEGAEMMQPMAVTTIGGLLYATLLTLLVVPIMYYFFTKYAKNIMSSLGIIVLLAGTVGGYIYLGYWYIILIGVVLVLAVIANWIFNNKKVA